MEADKQAIPRKLLLKPDDDMKWIYDNNHPDYTSDRAEYLRNTRTLALQKIPIWMKEISQQ